MSESKQIKKRGRPVIYDGDYTEEYKNYTRCPMCKHVTCGEDDFRHLRTGKITRTCKRCRERVYSSIKRTMKPAMSNKHKVALFTTILLNIDKDAVMIACGNNQDLISCVSSIYSE